MSGARDSLIDRLGQAARRGVRRPRADRLRLRAAVKLREAMLIAATVALAPLATLGGAMLLTRAVERESRDLSARVAARDAPLAERAEARAMLQAAATQPALVATLERLARVLPADARLMAVARGAEGGLSAEIAAGDPDLLRAALREDPQLAQLRNTGQRRGPDARVVVTMTSVP
jgi:hypothetical protein